MSNFNKLHNNKKLQSIGFNEFGRFKTQIEYLCIDIEVKSDYIYIKKVDSRSIKLCQDYQSIALYKVKYDNTQDILDVLSRIYDKINILSMEDLVETQVAPVCLLDNISLEYKEVTLWNIT